MKAQLIRKVSLAAFLGFAAFAATATEWKYYAKGADGSPYSTAACITDDNWVLRVSAIDTSLAVVRLEMQCVASGKGILDLREMTIAGKVYTLKFTNTSNSGYAFAQCATMMEFYADNVEIFGTSTFTGCTALTKASVSGTFEGIGTAAFSGCTSLTNVVVSSPNLNRIWGQAFMTSKPLTSIEITSDCAVTVDSQVLSGNSPVSVLTVNGPAWTQSSLDNLLTAVTAWFDGSTAERAKKNCTIYVDPTKGWDGVSTGYTDWTPATLTDAETAAKPKKCFGVYREGSRKAWLVATGKHGFRIIIR